MRMCEKENAEGVLQAVPAVRLLRSAEQCFNRKSVKLAFWKGLKSGVRKVPLCGCVHAGETRGGSNTFCLTISNSAVVCATSL